MRAREITITNRRRARHRRAAHGSSSIIYGPSVTVSRTRARSSLLRIPTFADLNERAFRAVRAVSLSPREVTRASRDIVKKEKEKKKRKRLAYLNVPIEILFSNACKLGNAFYIDRTHSFPQLANVRLSSVLSSSLLSEEGSKIARRARFDYFALQIFC